METFSHLPCTVERAPELPLGQVGAVGVARRFSAECLALLGDSRACAARLLMRGNAL
jgi:hypothetical protein